MDADRAGAHTEGDRQVRIFLLGGMRVFEGDNLLPPFPTQKSRSLFAYLLLTRRQTHTRGRLAGMFWGDSPENRARRSLNTTLWRLRRILPAAFILTESDVVRLNPSTPCTRRPASTPHWVRTRMRPTMGAAARYPGKG